MSTMRGFLGSYQTTYSIPSHATRRNLSDKNMANNHERCKSSFLPCCFAPLPKQIFQRNHSNEFDKSAHQPLPFEWFYAFFLWFFKARANARNIVGPNMLRALANHVVCCCVLLRLVGSCWMKFETGQTSEPTSANIYIVSRSSKSGPTMLPSFAQHIQQCCAGPRALHATYPHKYMRTRNQHGVGDGQHPRVLCILI